MCDFSCQREHFRDEYHTRYKAPCKCPVDRGEWSFNGLGVEFASLRNRGFHSRSGHGGITTLGKLFTPCALVTKQHNLTLVNGR